MQIVSGDCLVKFERNAMPMFRVGLEYSIWILNQYLLYLHPKL